ncbi:MAG TPA: glucoamylase family protein, partial [Capsulimonadaceae bacterium]|nr:glucoamylase family protein [Capsulimonadaceae bacterium]
LRDRNGYDFWVNFTNANLANHAFCIRNPDHFKTYSGSIWAVNASDAPDGYGAEDDRKGGDNGTVSPTGAIASMCFAPELGRQSLRALYSQYRDKAWGRYGFSNAFNVDKNWYDKDVIGIDLGMMLIATENHRSGLIWRLVMRLPFAQKGMAAAGFHRTKEAAPRPLLITPTTVSASF